MNVGGPEEDMDAGALGGLHGLPDRVDVGLHGPGEPRYGRALHLLGHALHGEEVLRGGRFVEEGIHGEVVLVRAEAQRLGGLAVLDSQPGRGTRLRVEAPLLDA